MLALLTVNFTHWTFYAAMWFRNSRFRDPFSVAKNLFFLPRSLVCCMFTRTKYSWPKVFCQSLSYECSCSYQTDLLFGAKVTSPLGQLSGVAKGIHRYTESEMGITPLLAFMSWALCHSLFHYYCQTVLLVLLHKIYPNPTTDYYSHVITPDNSDILCMITHF